MATARAPRFEVFPEQSVRWDGLDSFHGERQWFVRLRASNGSILMTSEGYTRPSKALRAAASIAAATGATGLEIRFLDS